MKVQRKILRNHFQTKLESDARNLRRPESSICIRRRAKSRATKIEIAECLLSYGPSTPPPGDINHGAGAGHLILYLALMKLLFNSCSTWMKPRWMKQSDWSKSGRAPNL